MDIVVFGAGSLGSLVGGLLAREHAVTLVGRDPHVAAVRESGLRVSGEYDFTVAPEATTDGTDLDADLAVVTVKAFDTEDAAETLATGRIDAVLSLQNGMGNEETLARPLDCPVLAGTATYGAVRREPGAVECTGRGEVVLGPREGGTSETADGAGRALAAAGIETTVADDMPRRLWEKLAVNAGINATTALARVENGALLDGPAREVAGDAARETARVARAEGVELGESEAVRAVERVAEATAANTSSMRQDVQAGRRTEVEAINGYVFSCARERGVSVPVNRTLTKLLRAWERERPQD
ncbi:ketopantoate reductase family protein [Halorussus gelatinilyticus]|uniref:2-dehydropantoate 2-reductase n=1 Tax=Halorussus gelatinilyticus TaxID=2937524 RepID=A0A8U0IKU6_9EURY|nr:ketopantoate reductase family protein [Halorussus gelatinilyticus]UPW01767.1 ketopantoate reductase family protein [Halorussus gelatinilyticus]